MPLTSDTALVTVDAQSLWWLQRGERAILRRDAQFVAIEPFGGAASTAEAALGLPDAASQKLNFLYPRDVTAGAFVHAGNGRVPRTGDVTRMTEQHVCVFLRVDTEGWAVVHAGQGGPRFEAAPEGTPLEKRKQIGHDSIKLGYVSPSAVAGWVDIELWKDEKVQASAPAVGALTGTWNVTIEWRHWAISFSRWQQHGHLQ